MLKVSFAYSCSFLRSGDGDDQPGPAEEALRPSDVSPGRRFASLELGSDHLLELRN